MKQKLESSKTMKIRINLLVLLISLGFIINTTAQNDFKQNIKGVILDEVSREPLVGANIVIEDMEPFTGTATDIDGKFLLENIPVGRISIKVTYLGYYPKLLSNLSLETGKELTLNIVLEEAIIQGKEIEIIAKQDKYKAINRMATVSARSFSIEETQRFAGARNDVSRMASSFAGVNQGNDSRNDIIIRGNSPMGLLWRYEGVDIPNPNHYGALGSTGGPVSILNNNVLSNSDFFTGAFPSEYGNAISGVFDLSMRNGNSDKHEFLGQVGFNGFELLAEGPISKKAGSSYLISYRYSTMAVMAALGADFGTGTAVPLYQDLSLKINLPTKKIGSFNIFAIGGISEIEFLQSEQDTTENEQDLYNGETEDLFNKSKMGIVGVSNTYTINKSTYTKLTLAASYHDFLVQIDSISPIDRSVSPRYRNDFKESKLSGVFFLSKKINQHHNFKAGIIVNQLAYQLVDSVYHKEADEFITLSDYNDNSWQFQPYISWQFQPTDKLSINGGLHYMYYSFNKTQSVEPRLGIRYQLKPGHAISLGYGLHSQTMPFTTYIKQNQLPNGSYHMYNENLDLMKSHHFVLGYDWVVNEHMRLKVETYYQSIFNAAVNAANEDTYSILNAGADFYIPVPDSLNNDGTGTNYGLEITFEQFLNRGFYYLFTGSLYESKYKGSNGVEYNTAFNGNYVVNGLLGKEFEIAKKRKKKRSINTLSFDVKATYAGGKRYTPIDVDQTVASGVISYVEDENFEHQFDNYFRFDIRAGFKQEFKKFSMEFSLDVQNLFDVQNMYLQRVNTQTGEITNYNQLGRLIIPQFTIRF